MGKLSRKYAMSNSPDLHLKIAEWILEHGEAVSVYDVMARFEITLHQATGHLNTLERDSAINMLTVGSIPTEALFSHCKRTVRTVTITNIDHVKIEQRKTFAYHNYKYHPVESVPDLPPAEKWEWIIRNSGRRKD
ncbi:hypothetical protein A6833_04870 [Salmonella enterica]|nr:hypothetical protein [Salmonella enterica]EBW8698330.1 hypothetical protein [Salmonella enterica subsp. diarizonae serovar 16:z10:e,n,x,z15]ECG1721608.1 hypothetical protein [Salmonella enterica subsp. diarizonae serovar 17:z10:e,n,x,z15]ECO1900337.1 hypothetical protein [Salmonella enterica subsp. diarizonae]EAA9302759.1 hypothetical protein [Salmonella enterica]